MLLRSIVEPQISHFPNFTAREKLVPIRHIFHTNILHFVKFAHVVKLYVAYMRNLHIDKNTTNLLHFAIDSKES